LGVASLWICSRRVIVSTRLATWEVMIRRTGILPVRGQVGVVAKVVLGGSDTLSLGCCVFTGVVVSGTE
jgi:hypothetical protein